MSAPTSVPRTLLPWIAAATISLGMAVMVREVVRFEPQLPAASTSQITVVPAPDVVRAVQSLARLETVNFHLERVMELRDDQTHLFGLVAASDAIVLVAAGDVTAGVDLSRLAASDVRVSWDARRVAVTLPTPEVLHAALDASRTHVYRRDTDTFAQRNEALETRARAEAERAMREAAREAGVIERARENGERAVRTLLGSMGFRDVDVRWRDGRIAQADTGR